MNKAFRLMKKLFIWIKDIAHSIITNKLSIILLTGGIVWQVTIRYIDARIPQLEKDIEKLTSENEKLTSKYSSETNNKINKLLAEVARLKAEREELILTCSRKNSNTEWLQQQLKRQDLLDEFKIELPKNN